MKYWNKTGEYQDKWDELFQDHVPPMGPSKTLGGEAIRACGKIYYDAYNNGFCNNTSNAINFLKEYTHMVNIKFDDVYAELHEPCVRDDGYTRICPQISEMLDSMIDRIVEHTIKNPAVLEIDSKVDMLDDEYYEEFDDECLGEEFWDDEDCQ